MGFQKPFLCLSKDGSGLETWAPAPPPPLALKGVSRTLAVLGLSLSVRDGVGVGPCQARATPNRATEPHPLCPEAPRPLSSSVTWGEDTRPWDCWSSRRDPAGRTSDVTYDHGPCTEEGKSRQ